MCGYVSFSHKSTEITRRKRRAVFDSQSCVHSPLRQFSHGAMNRCHAYSTMTRVAGIWKPFLVHSAVLRLHVVRLSVCPSVCDVGGSGSHRLEILETNCMDTYPNTFTLRSPKAAIHLIPGKHGEIWGDEVGWEKWRAGAQKRQYL